MKRATLQLPISERKNNGAIAQLVEQRTENPCVPSSILGGTTRNPRRCSLRGVVVLLQHEHILFCTFLRYSWQSLSLRMDFVRKIPPFHGWVIDFKQLSEKSSRDWNTPYPYTRPEADFRFSLRNIWLFRQSPPHNHVHHRKPRMERPNNNHNPQQLWVRNSLKPFCSTWLMNEKYFGQKQISSSHLLGN